MAEVVPTVGQLEFGRARRGPVPAGGTRVLRDGGTKVKVRGAMLGVDHAWSLQYPPISKHRTRLVDHPLRLIRLLFWDLQGPSFADIGLFLCSVSFSGLRTTSFFCFCLGLWTIFRFRLYLDFTLFFVVSSAPGPEFSLLLSCFRIVHIKSSLFTDISLSRTKTL